MFHVPGRMAFYPNHNTDPSRSRLQTSRPSPRRLRKTPDIILWVLLTVRLDHRRHVRIVGDVRVQRDPPVGNPGRTGREEAEAEAASSRSRHRFLLAFRCGKYSLGKACGLRDRRYLDKMHWCHENLGSNTKVSFYRLGRAWKIFTYIFRFKAMTGKCFSQNCAPCNPTSLILIKKRLKSNWIR